MNWNLDKTPERLLVTMKTANLDASVANQFLTDLLPLLSGNVPVVIDIAAVKFVDSSGLGVLCRLAEKSTPTHLRLVGVSERLAKALSRAHLLTPFWTPRPTLVMRTA